MSTAPAPVSARERIQSIDTLRGVALLGILLMNIVAFAYPLAAYSDPTGFGGMDAVNENIFIAVDMLFEGSMRAIFSMLFGAGLLIFAAKPGADPALVKGLYYRRTLLLVVFGLVNAYIFVWPGDILYTYGMAGLLLYFFKDMSPRRLTLFAAVILTGLLATHAGQHFSIKQQRLEVVAIETLPEGMVLTQDQTQKLVAWEELLTEQLASEEMIARELAARKSGYVDNFIAAAQVSIFLQTIALLFNTLWDTLSMMLLGMAFMKWGIFDASRSMAFYRNLALGGFAVGIPLNAWETMTFVNSGYELYYSASLRPTYDIGRLSLAIAYIGVVMCICKSGVFTLLRTALAAVGQMALTNYLSQSVICGFIFLGFGFGLVGELERIQIYYVVIAIWIFQMIFSSFWLKRYRFGPAEWLWRSLTYKSRQPLRL